MRGHAPLLVLALLLPATASAAHEHPDCTEVDGDTTVRMFEPGLAGILLAMLVGGTPSCVSVPSGAVVTFESWASGSHNVRTHIDAGACFSSDRIFPEHMRYGDSVSVRYRYDPLAPEMLVAEDAAGTRECLAAADPMWSDEDSTLLAHRDDFHAGWGVSVVVRR